MNSETNSQGPVAPFYKRVGEIIRDPSIWENVDRVDAEAIEGSEIVVHDVMFLRGTMGDTPGDYAVLLFAGPDDAMTGGGIDGNGKELPENAHTTMIGGQVFVRKMKLISGELPDTSNQLPILGRLVMPRNRADKYNYWDFR